MNTNIDLLKVALKKDIGIDLTNEENKAFSKLDEDSQDILFQFIHSSDYIECVQAMLIHILNTAKVQNKENVAIKCVNWLEKLNTSEEIKSNIKKLLKSC